MRIYLLKRRHGFHPQDEFKFMSAAPNVKDLFLFSDAKLLHCHEFFVRCSLLCVNCNITNQYSNKRQDRHQKHRLSHRHYILPHLGHTNQRIHQSLYHNHRH